MNRIYRLIWNHTLGALVPVAEIIRSKHGGPSRRVGARRLRLAPLSCALALALAPTLARAQPMAQAGLPLNDLTGTVRPAVVGAGLGSQGVVPPGHPLPVGGQVVSGSVTFDQRGSTLTIDQTSTTAILDWQSFDIGADQTVSFNQPGSDSVALNRVLGTDPSAIYGHLNANGQVFLVNPYGVYFAPGARVDVGGLVASTLDIRDDDFLAGRYRFGGSSTAGVRNDGTIHAAPGGYVAFLGRTVTNTGALTTPGGTTALGAGSRVELTLAGHDLVRFQVSGATLDALAANGGVIAADGGRVILTAQARDALLRTVVNNTGRIQAQTVQNHGGTIELLGGDAGTVQVAGTLDASAPNGGDGGAIDTSGTHVSIADNASITTKAAAGADGSWLIDPQDFTIAASGGDITGTALSTALASGNVTIQSTTGGASGNGDIFVDDTVSWSSNTLTLNAYRDIVVNTAMNGSGSAGLAFEYGQGSTNGVIGSTTASYTVNAPINLTSAGSFSTKLGSAGSTVNYTIIDSLGSAGSTTGTDLQGISGNLTGNYVLGADIDASATASWNAGHGFSPIGNYGIGSFTGTFDGLGHTVSGLAISESSNSNAAGLFGINAGTLRNVGVIGGNLYYATPAGLGALAGINTGTISHAYATTTVGGSNAGGLVGSNSGTIIDSYATGTVNGNHIHVGGLVGYNASSGSISHAYATGNVNGPAICAGGLVGQNDGTVSHAYATGSVSGTDGVGGLVGINYGAITQVYATGDVQGTHGVGGLVGTNYGAITKVYATGDIQGTNAIGGLVGFNTASIQNVYATGNVDGTINVGGLIGWNNNGGSTTNAYATGNASGSTNVGGLVGLNSASSTVTNGYWDTATGLGAGFGSNAGTVTGGGGLTTAELAAALPTGFDSSVWANGDNQTTPYLLAGASFDTVGGHVILGSDASTTPTYFDVIQAVDQLQAINTTGLSGHYVLGNDIDASATASWNGGAGFDPIGNSSGSAFTGVFDGLGYTINDLTINRPTRFNVGLFGYFSEDGELRNIGVVGGSVTGYGTVGALVGTATSLTGTVTISNAYASADVSGNTSIGGLVGKTDHTVIDNAYASGDVSGTDSVGGLVGISSSSSSISNAYATGNVVGGDYTGGLIGIGAIIFVTNTYATGDVTGAGYVGGLIGSFDRGTVTGVYATGSVSGSSDVGGLIGLNKAGSTVTDGYWDTTTGLSVGFGSNLGTVTGGGGLTTAELAAALPTGFDASVWANGADATGNGQTTPYLLANAGFDTVAGSVILGSDTSATPTYFNVIQTLDQLQNINSTGLADRYVLGADIDASATSGWNSGAGFAPIGTGGANAFSGIFDGLDHTISGLTIARATADNVGLFGYVTGSNSVLRNVGLVGGSVSGRFYVGALVGRASTASGTVTISHAYASTDVDGQQEVGGLIGGVSRAQISQSHASGHVTGSSLTGGLVGQASNAMVSNAYATGDVDGDSITGGLIGVVSYGSVTGAYATGVVTGNGQSGGLVGMNLHGSISEAYATGTVTGSSDVGGLVGFNDSGTITHVYATGDVSGTTNVGGVLGVNTGGTLTGTYATGRVSGSTRVGGVVGVNEDSATLTDGYWDTTTAGTGVGIGSNSSGATVTGGGGLTTAELAAALPAGFDASVWANGDNQTTPYLLANASFDTVGGHVIQASDSSATPTYFDVIQTLDQLQNINTTGLSGDYVLGNDIDASATVSWNGGAGFDPIGSSTNAFTGLFDGLDHTISGLNINRSGANDVGLFGYTAGTLRHVGLSGGTIVGRSNVGALAGENHGIVDHAHASSTVGGHGSNVGGLIGFSSNGILTNVYATGPVTSYGGTSNIGGLVGFTRHDTISDAYATGDVSNVIFGAGGLAGVANSTSFHNVYATGHISGTSDVGGLVGSNRYGDFYNTYATGDVDGSRMLGGLIGENDVGTIDNAYASGNVSSTGTASGTNGVGGLIGSNSNAIVSHVYATGNVSGTNEVGGLIGLNYHSTVSSAYATGRVSGTGSNTVGGLIGVNNSNSSVTNGYWDTTTTGLAVGIGSTTGGSTVTGSAGLTTAQLAAALPTGFDASVWANGADATGTGQTTPYLLANANFDTVGGHVILGSDGSATPTYYDVIQTLDQLQAINTTGLAGDYVLGNDIDASATAGWNSGAGFDPVGSSTSSAFSGVFDGLGHTVSNLTINRPSTDDVGLFGVVGSGGVLRDLGLLGGSVTGHAHVGALVGQAYGSTGAGSVTISDVYAATDVNGMGSIAGGLIGWTRDTHTSSVYATGNVSVSGVYAGGLIGVADTNSTLTDAYATGNVSGTFSGGLIGYNGGNSTVTNVHATGDVSGTSNTGGLIGSNNNGTVTDAYATGTVTGSRYIGGLIGYNQDNGNLSNVYATGNVSGVYGVGGLIGSNYDSTITNAYATGDVSGTDEVGGLAGINENHASIQNAYATGDVDGTTSVGGLIGWNSNNSSTTHAYATGNVSGSTNVGGLVGVNSNNSAITGVYATGSVSGSTNAGGLIGLNTSTSTVTNGYWDTTSGIGTGIGSNAGTLTGSGGLTTAQLAAALPAGFDASVWANGDNQTTPYLLANASFDTVGGHVILGSDSSATPAYFDVIQTLDQLQNINTTGLSGAYVLGNDIDASATTGWNGGAGFDPIGSSTNAFTGVFDGLDHTISGLSINRPGANDIGLFGYTAGTLRHVGLSGGTIVGAHNVGALAGENIGIVDHAHASSTVGGHNSNVGGLIGYSSNGTITNAYATGPVTSYGGTSNIGGLVGVTRNDTISDAYATGDVSGGIWGGGGLAGFANGTSFHDVHATGNVSGKYAVGGLVGSNSVGDFYNVYATGNVDGRQFLGGLIGENDGGTIDNAYASGNVSSTGAASGTNGVGGLIGSNSNAIVSHVYATGSVSGTNEVGGLIGLNYHSTVSSAYATGRVSGTGSNTTGGLIGVNDSNSSVTNGYWDTTTGLAVGIGSNTAGSIVTGSAGLTTAQLAAALPTGFDASVWANGADATGTGQTTPYLLANASFDTVGGHVILGSDSSATPTYYDVIQTLDQLQNINTTGLSGDYVLGNDIDASATASWNGGAGFDPIGSSTNAFTGLFDGLDHTISGLNINRSGANDIGLFGYTVGTLRHVGLSGGTIVGRSNVGALAGENHGIVDHAHASSTVGGHGSNVGGLIGFSSNGILTNVYATGPVTSYGGTSNIGGLVGFTRHDTISDAYATGDVSNVIFGAGGLAGVANSTSFHNVYATGHISGTSDVGGLVGSNRYGDFYNTYATGDVDGSRMLGGLIGENDVGTIDNAYASGNVSSTGTASGTNGVGGLIGSNSNAIVSHVYATGNVSGTNEVGGLIGLNYHSTVSSAYATGRVSGTGSNTVGGLIGVNDSNSSVTNGYWDTTTTGLAVGIGSTTGGSTVTGSAGLTTAQLAAALPTGFDASVWANGADATGTGQTTPYLLANANFDTVGGHVILGSDGSATPTYYDVIQTLDQLQAINTTGLAGDYVLGNDIDASATAGWNGGAGFDPIGSSTSNAFSGVFDGLGHTVSNLTINRPSTDDVGLFGAIGSGGVLRDLGLLGGSVTGHFYVGALVGQAYSPTSAGSITISNVYAATDVSGTTQVGGLIGNTHYADIDNAYATGSVSGSGDMAGGLVGQTFYGTIRDVYASGDVSGAHYVGGLVGASFEATINNTFATGTVSGSNGLGALVGLFGSGTVANGYWNTTTGLATGFGIESGTVTGGGGLTSTQMMQQSSFTGFDFGSPTWVIYEGHTAPLLNAFLTQLTVTAGDQTQTYNGGTFDLSGPTYSVTGADTSGHLFGLADAYNGATDVGTYAPGLWSDQQGYRVTYVGGALTIDPKLLTLNGLSAYDKVYDGATTATVGSFGSLTGIVGSDSVSLVSGGTSAAFANANAGTGKTVTVSGLALSGADAGNYSIGIATTSADIAPKALTLSGLTADDKVYDGNTAATIGSFGRLIGIVGSDSVSLASDSNASFADANAGTGKTVTVSGLALSGADAGNYSLVSTDTTTANITPKTLSVSLIGNPTRNYDGTTVATLDPSNFQLSGFVAGQGASITQTLGSYATADAGVGIPVAALLGAEDVRSDDGTLLSNYVLPGTATGTGTIRSAVDPGFIDVSVLGRRSSARGYTGVDVFSLALDPRLQLSIAAPGKPSGVALDISQAGTPAAAAVSPCPNGLNIDPFAAPGRCVQ